MVFIVVTIILASVIGRDFHCSELVIGVHSAIFDEGSMMSISGTERLIHISYSLGWCEVEVLYLPDRGD